MHAITSSSASVLAGLLILAVAVGGESPAAKNVDRVPDAERERLSLSPFYSRYCRATGGIPVVASDRVQPEALAEAAWLIDRMLDRRPDVARAIARSPVRFVVMACDEFTTDVPEHADLEPRDHWDRRARGLGATLVRPAVSCGEENLLCLEGDPYATENILVHEFGHTIHEIGLAQIDPTFQDRLEAAFADAKQNGRWAGTYAMDNPSEYWAEGVQSWLRCNRTNDREHGEVNSAAAVRTHDPPLAALLTEVFGEEPWAYRRPAERPAAERRHVDGFDATAAPAFSWDALSARRRGTAVAPATADVLDTRSLVERETFWDNRDTDWFVDHIPAFECPDADIQTTWYYRWELITKHLTYGSPNTGYLFTEFLDRPFWSGAYGGISCPAGHQLYEARWLRKPRIARDYCRYWIDTKGAQPRNYSTWLADSVWAVHLVHPAAAWLAPGRQRPPADVFPTDLLTGLEANTAGWRTKHFVPERHLFWQVGHDDGMEFNIASRQSKDILRGAPSYRPSFNAYQWADLQGLANLHELAGDAPRAAEHRAEADRLRDRTEEMLWDEKREFFLIAFRDDETADGHVVKANSRIYETGKFAGSPHGRELIGYVPWQFDMPSQGRGYERAWKFLMNPDFFFADFGPTTVERHDPQFLLQKSCCWWSGQSWPYATTQTLKAMANLLQRRKQDFVSEADYLRLLAIYARTHRKLGRPYLAEACHPDTGSFDGHDGYNHSEHYFHSGYADLVVTGLMGLVPRKDDVLEVRPLFPAAWDYCALDHVTYRGREIAVVWDRTGSRYGLGKGLNLVANGRVLATSPGVGPLEAALPPVAESLERLTTAGEVDEGLRPGLAPSRVNVAVNNDGTYFPRYSVSSTAEGTFSRMLADGVAWYLRSPPNRWASEEQDGDSATIEVDFGTPRTIDSIRLFVLDDDPAILAGTADAAVPGRGGKPSSVRAPERIEMDVFDGTAWVPVKPSASVPDKPIGHRANTLSFDPIEMSKFRVRLVPQAGCQVGLSEIEAWGDAVLPWHAAPPPAGNLAFNPGGKGAPEFPKVTASFTSRFDAVGRAIDGIVSFTPTPPNRWTAYESPEAKDWLEIEFGGMKTVGRVELAIFDDRGGVQPPEAYAIEIWDGASWLAPEHQRRSPPTPTGGAFNTVTFDPVRAVKLRLTFTHRGKARSGVSEVMVWEK